MMKPFEAIDQFGRIYIDNDRWREWRSQRFAEYPCPSGHWRFDLLLCLPSNTLEEVPVFHNPHNRLGYSGHTCFYECDDWSTIFEAHEEDRHDIFGEYDGYQYRMLVESGHSDPMGERIKLLSTSSYIENEPWGMNPQNTFAEFRGMYWAVARKEFLHEWRGGIGYPLHDGGPWGVPRRESLSLMVGADRFWERIEDLTMVGTGILWKKELHKPEKISWTKNGF